MTRREEPGCRDAGLATALLLGIGLAFMGSGLAMINQPVCDGTCEFAGLSILYAGGPIGAMIGFLTDSIVIAWPLEVMLWVVLGFWAARRAANRDTSTWGHVISILVISLVYGVVLSRFVELA